MVLSPAPWSCDVSDDWEVVKFIALTYCVGKSVGHQSAIIERLFN